MSINCEELRGVNQLTLQKNKNENKLAMMIYRPVLLPRAMSGVWDPTTARVGVDVCGWCYHRQAMWMSVVYAAV